MPNTSPLSSQMTNERREVLVADAEQATRRLVAQAVAALGLVAHPVRDGAAAIVAVAMRPTAFICAFVNTQLPIVSGIDTAEAIRRVAPNLALVLIRNTDADPETERDTSLHRTGVLHKPFSPEVLHDLVRQVVEETVGAARLLPERQKSVGDGVLWER